MDTVNKEASYQSLLFFAVWNNGGYNNVDRTGVLLGPKAYSVVLQTGTKKVHYGSTRRKGQLTVV